MKIYPHILLISLIFAASCKNSETSKNTMDILPPQVEKKEKHLEIHGDVRIDNYYWLNDRENEEVIDYLERENDYYNKMTAHTKDFQNLLFEEMKGRIKEDDASVPYFYNGYYYITRYETGKDYPIHSRKKGSLDAPEEIMFNVNDMAQDYAYYSLRGVTVSPDNQWAAFGVDTLSRRKYTLFVKNLATGEILKDEIPNTTGSATWANDNKTLFYTRKDEQTLRADRIYRHSVGENPDNDVLVFTETDETFDTFIYKTKSEKFLVIGSTSTLTSEYQILDANTPLGTFKIFQPRVPGMEYTISHFENNFYIVTNKDEA
ncbi:MAG: S9 family peptidase, partial [Flavobacteriaceae bacterium]|nr:S9 family peptidase [Flavobacteriaceae bacterium]